MPTSWEATDTTDIAAGLTVNLADSTSNYINITGVQLEVGTEATPFEHRPYDMELARCQRYYPKSINDGTTSYASANGYGRGMYLFPSQMRATPAMVFTNGGTGGSKIGDSIASDGFYVTYGSLTASQAGTYSWTASAEL